MTVCQICGEIDMTTILDLCRECEEDKDEYFNDEDGGISRCTQCHEKYKDCYCEGD